MATTTKQDQGFSEVMRESVGEVKMSSSALQNAIDWIASNLDPDDIWGSDVSSVIQKSYEPEDLFSTKQLDSWAESNGYTKE